VTAVRRARVAVAQMDCVLGEVGPNLETIDRLAGRAAGEGAELVVFPECATTGYFVADRLPALAQPADGPVVGALAGMARRRALHLAVGLALVEDGRYYDAQALFSPRGDLVALYRKAHLFAAERRWYAAGDTPLVVDTPLGRLGMTICYDLLFPEYIRALVDLGAEIIVNSTDWIADDYQRQVWGWSGPTTRALAATRALENGIHVAMANRVGQELGFTSLGWSSIVGPSGRILAGLEEGEGTRVTDIVLESEDLARWRGIATYLADRRPELYRRPG
jgi:predicted amidohydrolase